MVRSDLRMLSLHDLTSISFVGVSAHAHNYALTTVCIILMDAAKLAW